MVVGHTPLSGTASGSCVPEKEIPTQLRRGAPDNLCMTDRKKPRKQRRIARRAAKVVAVYDLWTKTESGYFVRIYSTPFGVMPGPEHLVHSYMVPAGVDPMTIRYVGEEKS